MTMNSRYEEWYDEQLQSLEYANEKLVRIRERREERAKRLGITDPIQLEFDFEFTDD